MRITTKAVYDMETMALLSWEGYEYDGPVDRFGGGPSAAEQAQTQLAQQQSAAAQQAQAQSAASYATTSPGLGIAENYYKALSSGDPQAIFKAASPSINAVIGNTEAAKRNIQLNMPKGGEQNLALEQADIAKASQIGNLETTAYTSSFPALANLASTGLGLSVNEMANAIAGFQGASQSQSSIMQADAANKASTMGFLGSLAGGAGMALGGL